MFIINCHRVVSIRNFFNCFKLSSTTVQQSAINKRHLYNLVKPLEFCNNIIRITELPSVLSINSISYSTQRDHKGNLDLLQIRKNHNTMERNLDDPREFKIKVPYGHVAGKVWNESAPVAVLCLHGWQDNAGTFDTLAPLLPKHLCLVAIDFPGHGFSTHKPLGFSTLVIDYVLCVDRVVKHFGWEQVVILGHSMGAGTGVLYAGIRPDVVHSLVMIDLIKLHHTPAEKQPSRTKRAMDDILAAENKILNVQRPSYPFEELLQRAMKSHESSLDEAGVKTLLKRGSEQLPSGRYTFTYDLQIRTHSIISMTLEQQMAFAECIRCRLLILKAKDGPYYEAKEHYDAILNIYRSSSREFQYLTVPGRHHTHLDTPQHVAPLIADFLSLEKLGSLQNNLFCVNEKHQGSENTKTRVMLANESLQSVL